MPALLESRLPFPLLARGKVRDIYRVPEGLLLVATDRLSAFDVVFGDPIPGKGAVLTQMSRFWFEVTRGVVPNHMITARAEDVPSLAPHREALAGRAMLCREAKPLPIECVVRGYLEGSAWKDYQAKGEVSGVRLPAGLARRARIEPPIFTPSTKAEAGHDEPITFAEVVNLIGVEHAEMVRLHSLQLFELAHARLLEQGILLSDTKFEFGIAEGELLLIDEALTPDSSRFWEAATYRAGMATASMDKQYVRDYVERIGWTKTPPAPPLPADVIAEMSRRYLDIFRRVTGESLNVE